MTIRKSYYQGLAADYSRPGIVNQELAKDMIAKAEEYIAKKESMLPIIDGYYTKQQVEEENKNWWPTHCEALRQGRGDLLSAEYREELYRGQLVDSSVSVWCNNELAHSHVFRRSRLFRMEMCR